MAQVLASSCGLGGEHGFPAAGVRYKGPVVALACSATRPVGRLEAITCGENRATRIPEASANALAAFSGFRKPEPRKVSTISTKAYLERGAGVLEAWSSGGTRVLLRRYYGETPSYFRSISVLYPLHIRCISVIHPLYMRCASFVLPAPCRGPGAWSRAAAHRQGGASGRSNGAGAR